MKVQFIWPNFDCPLGLSMGLAYLSGALRAAGHDTSILHISEWLDYPFDLDRIESDVKDYDPDLIAMSTGVPHYPEMTQMAQALKDAARPADHPRRHPRHAQHPERDEGESLHRLRGTSARATTRSIDLVHAFETGGDTTNIPNVWARRDGKIVRNPSRPLKDISKSAVDGPRRLGSSSGSPRTAAAGSTST